MQFQSIRNIPWEMLGLLALIICMILFSYGLGLTFVKLYRKFRPFPDDENASILLVQEEKRDSRLKIILLGWILTSVLFIGGYQLIRVVSNAWS